METHEGRSNRGPAAAPANRASLVRAARHLFAERGYRVPLSAVAREAGVGQGVLYRHFPTRMDLALEVFEENLADLERVTRTGEPEAFHRLWGSVLGLVVSDVSFIETVVEVRRTHTPQQHTDRIRQLLDTTLVEAHRTGTVPPDVDVEVLLVSLRAAYGVAVTADDRETAWRGITLLMSAFGLPVPPSPPGH